MDPIVGQALVPEFRTGLVILSYLISVFGSYVALECARLMVRADGKTDWPILIGAAVSLGGVGIWAMHFIGMLAYRLEVTVSYEVIPTVISLAAAVLISGLALFLTGGRGRFRVSGWLAGSVLAGLGIAAMHYLGLYAMSLRATMMLDPATVALSVAIAIVAACAALWLAFNLSKWIHRALAALTMGIAVCTMHYVGMTAATLICVANEPTTLFAIRGSRMEVWIVMTSIFVLAYVYWITTSRFFDKFVGKHAANT